MTFLQTCTWGPVCSKRGSDRPAQAQLPTCPVLPLTAYVRGHLCTRLFVRLHVPA